MKKLKRYDPIHMPYTQPMTRDELGGYVKYDDVEQQIKGLKLSNKSLRRLAEIDNNEIKALKEFIGNVSEYIPEDQSLIGYIGVNKSGMLFLFKETKSPELLNRTIPRNEKR